MNGKSVMTAHAESGRVAVVLLLAAILAGPAIAFGGSLEPQVSRAGGVEVSVTPGALAADAEVWEFEVTFNTHSGALDGNPAESSVLIDAQGGRHAALEWEGMPPGGHHRSGVLRFRTPDASAGMVELRIGGVGGIDVRTFRWER